MKNQKVKKLTPDLDNLMMVHNKGLLEPYILFVKPDRGIAEDYVPYRKANRAKLKQYWKEVVVGVK
jgi:hypothetical protein